MSNREKNSKVRYDSDSLIAVQEIRMLELEREVDILKSIVEEEHLEHYQCIFKQNEQLKAENKDIKAFLSDYGFSWLGSSQKSKQHEINNKVVEVLKTEHNFYDEPMMRNPAMMEGQGHI